MINLDMVGRAGGRILVDGIANAPSIEDDLKVAQKSSGISLTALKGSPGAGASDDASFSLRKIPAINFFSGFHADYHRPRTPGTRSTRRAARLWRTWRWRSRARSPTGATRPEFVDTVQESARQAPPVAVSGYGPYFGSVPDFADEGQGVKFAEVRPGSPAAKAGFQKRRCADRVRRRAHQEPLRLHVCAPGKEARRQGGSDGDERRQGHHRDRGADEQALRESKK